MKDIFFSNEEIFKEKVQKIKAEGINNLHVVSDFDRTLTKCFMDNKKIPSGVSLIRDGGYLTEDYPKKAFALFDKYHPIEIDTSLDYKFRSKMMKEWWEEHLKLLIKSGVNKETFENIILKYPKLFRDGSGIFFDYLYKNKIPLLIFSAGIGNLIEGYLEKENRLTENIHILSNTLKFDEEGKAIGYKNNVIHSMNKSETEIEDPNYKRLISQRKNILLLGDSLEDSGMTNNIDSKTVIRIGFLNEEIEKSLDIYKSKFDVLVLGDGTMEFVNDLLNQLTN